nr:hypothetical protein [Gammaproteobacteria bacterium]
LRSYRYNTLKVLQDCSRILRREINYSQQRYSLSSLQLDIYNLNQRLLQLNNILCWINNRELLSATALKKQSQFRFCGFLFSLSLLTFGLNHTYESNSEAIGEFKRYLKPLQQQLNLGLLEIAHQVKMSEVALVADHHIELVDILNDALRKMLVALQSEPSKCAALEDIALMYNSMHRLIDLQTDMFGLLRNDKGLPDSAVSAVAS